jgi:hypothetical protein
VHADRIPPSLRTLRRWLLWKYVTRDGKPTKAPFQPNGKPAKSNDPNTWCSLEEALKALETKRFAGLGFVLGDGITGVDLDWKDYTGNGVPLEAQTIVDRLNSYVEWSPSKRGCHVLVLGNRPQGAHNRKPLAPGVGVEVYDSGRYFTVTGEAWTGYPIDLQDRQAELEALCRELWPQEERPAPVKGTPAPTVLDDAELLRRMFSAKNGSELERLWAGDWSGYPSQSEGDLALAGALMFWTANDTARADRLFRQSGLFRPKWDEVHSADGRTYGEMTLKSAWCANPYSGATGRLRLNGEADPGHPLEGLSGGGELEPGKPRYCVLHGAIHAGRVEGRDERRAVTYWPLANFAAVIRREVKLVDGVEPETLFELEGYLASGRPLPTARVKASEFAGLGWVSREWGASAIVTPGQGAKDHLRAAIQHLSEGRITEATVYKHLGWAKIGESWVYLHAAGGIGAQAVEGLEVEPGRSLEAFALPAPPEGAEEARAIRQLWELHKVAPTRVTLPLILYALGAPLGHAPFSLYLAGPTGSRKTSLALVIQSLWGHVSDPPTNWESTPNALEAQAFAAKDSLLLVDDYAPQASEHRQKELQAKAGRLLRNQGNGAGRARMRSDGTLAGDKPPRGSLLITGEDLPPGHSVRARCLFIEITREDVDNRRLREAQALAREGTYAKALAGWVRWLAAGLESYRTWLTRRLEELRPQWSCEHGRTTDALARLHATWELYARYAAERGVDLAGLEAEVMGALEALREAQAGYQREADPVEAFGGLLMAALRMGRCHLAPVGWKPGEALEDYLPDPATWGWKWRESLSGLDSAKLGVWEPQGPAIGWIPEDHETRGLYLDPRPAYAVLTRLAAETGAPLPTERTLWKRLSEAGAIRVAEEAGKLRYLVRVRVGDHTPRVVHLLGAYIARSGNSGNNEENTVQDGAKPVPTFSPVPTREWEQNPDAEAAPAVFPLASGNTQASGNTTNPVQDANITDVPTVPTRGDKTPLGLRNETPQGEAGTHRGRGVEALLEAKRRAVELVEALRALDPDLAALYFKQINRSPLEAAPGLVGELEGELARFRKPAKPNAIGEDKHEGDWDELPF